MSTAEKVVLSSVAAQPPPSVHEVQPQRAPATHGKPYLMQRVEHRTMNRTSSAQAHRSPSEDSRVGRLDGPFVSRPRCLSDKRGNTTQPKSFHPEGIQRLSMAIINHAVRDLLENGKHSLAAERWLLSQEFDWIHNLLG